MNEILLNLVVLAAVLCLIAVVFWGSRRRRQDQEQALRLMAKERGWKVVPIRERLAWGFRVDGPGWTLQSLSRSAPVEAGPGSSNIAESTCWQAACAGTPALIGPRLTPALAGNELGQVLAQQLVAREMGPPAAGLRELKAGSGALRERYSLWATSPASLEGMLVPAVESALMHWKGKPPVIRRAEGMLNIEIHGERYTTAEQIGALVQLGEALLARC